MARKRSVSVSRRKSLWVLFVGLALVGTIVCALFYMRSNLLREEVESQIERYIDEISQRVAETVNDRVNSSFEALKATAAVYQTLPARGEADAYLKTIVKQYEFRRIGVAGPDGPLNTTDGHAIPLEQLPGVRKVLEGAAQATDLITSTVDGEQVIVYAVPIRENDVVIGALTATNSQEKMRDYLGVGSFGGRGFSAVVNGKGDFIAHTSSHGEHTDIDNFFDLLERGTMGRGYSLDTVRADIIARRSGRLYYTLADGQRKIMCYVPLKVSDWYLLSVVPYEVAGEGIGRYMCVSAVVDGVIITLFLILITVLATVSWRGQKQIEVLAFVDEVTKGPNRAAFERDATALLSRAPARSYALVSLDLQDFKLVNESFGSAIGDEILSHIYKVISATLEEGELVGRIGDDVFNVLVWYTGRQSILQRMAALDEEVNRFNQERRDEDKYYLSLAQGVYVVEDPTLDIITIQDRANEARKSGKTARNGRTRSCNFYDELYQERMRREKEIDNRMESALSRGEFIIYLQPKVELTRNSVAGAEALIRWNDPVRGFISPGEFIPLFERNGFITKLDRYVFEHMCILLRRWMDEGRNPIPVSVNLSRRNVENPGFLDEYVHIRDSYRIPPHLLELEITESLFLENGEALLALIRRIREAGFQCSLDDFGSGYSSLSLLRVIPVDIIKLDRVFFMDAKHSQRSEYVVQGVLELARRLKIKTVCEGVEDPFHLKSLKRLQCDMIQGFIFSPPVPIVEFETMAFSGAPMIPREIAQA